MALATKCPHCNTVFRVAHDQLKLRGGIVRCGSCNEVFDGNAALLEPPAPLPASIPFDQQMAALDTRAEAVLASAAPEPALELDATPEPAAPELEPELEPATAFDIDLDDEAVASAPPIPLPAELATLPPNTEALFDLDLNIESEPDLEASSEPEIAAVPASDAVLDDLESLGEEELEAALEAELQAMEQTLADVQHDADGQPITEDAYANMSGGRIEPTWDEAPLDEPQAGAGPALDHAFAAADAAIFSADDEVEDSDAEAAPASTPHVIDADLASFLGEADAEAAPAEPEPALVPSRPRRDDELDEVDEEALVQLSSAGLNEAQSARAHAYLHTATAEEAPAYEAHAEPEEPGFVKRDRQRQKFGKAATIAMSLGSVLLVGALLMQAVTTFRNSIAATVPALKPALAAACQTLGCKIELPTQIDDLTIEQGELQTLSDTTFSFTTLLRNQSATAQAWPSIELTLEDDKDKRVLRRVFGPRDYLHQDVAFDQGFAPHTEQAVKLYFELRELKASGYHIAVFYP
ncbi:DUF3426 domain-containing protein [Duganella sacchari]|uniref:DUF3426 domain-containing protein n=1 Tax=Duganella sacchari TaxID=551987 RepID=UPI0009329059|nr:DUF3426 domain-containing protein [Duganella sacchari]